MKHIQSVIIVAALISLAFGSSEQGSSTTESVRTTEKTEPPSTSETVEQPTTAEAKKATGKKTITGNRVGCIAREDFEKLSDYAGQQDHSAFQQLLALGLSTGRCIRFTEGETVYVMDTAVFSGLVRVRRAGETIEYWTNVEAVFKR